MSAPKKPVLKALSDSHLRAIGLVAAQWAEFEFTLLWVISKVVKTDLKTTVILAGSQNATAWCEMLSKLTNPPQIPGKPKVKSSMDAITVKVQNLLRQRNEIVHTSWHDNSNAYAIGLLDDISTSRPKASQKAIGAAIPKRGNKIFLETAYTTREMLAVATQIQEVERELFGWWNQRTKTNRLAELLRTPVKKSTPMKNLGLTS